MIVNKAVIHKINKNKKKTLLMKTEIKEINSDFKTLKKQLEFISQIEKPSMFK